MRKVIGDLLGTGVFVLGMYGWYYAHRHMPPAIAWRHAAKAGALYWLFTGLLGRWTAGS